MRSVIVPAMEGVTTMVTVAWPWLGSEPRLQLTTLPALAHVPWLAVADTKVTDPGSVFVNKMPVAGEGPRLVTVTV